MNDIFSIFPYGRDKSLVKFSNAKKAFLYYVDHRINLLTGNDEKYSINNYLNELDQKKLRNEPGVYEVHHFYYELSEIILNRSYDELANNPLAIELVYSKKSQFNGEKNKAKIQFKKIKVPSKISYKKLFTQGRQELLNGNSYQFNLTQQFEFSLNNATESNIVSSFEKLGTKRGQYAHLTSIPYLNQIILSNSPEGLFQLRKKGSELECLTTPIKGTLKRDIKLPLSKQWCDLKNDEKNQAELYMIIDLLRNDLSSIEKPHARVLSKKALVQVPGLIHQMGVISIYLSANVSIGRVVRALFPGGSITGAPKKSTYKILKNLESRARGSYTGSTLLIANGRADCSINIRTAEIKYDSKKLTYGSGGGITLLSNWSEEYREMCDKVDSFMNAVFKS